MKSFILNIRLRGLLLVFFAISALVFTSCDDDDDDDMAMRNITQIVVDDDDFSLLEAAVVRAGLDDDLSSGTLTVFAPDNDAFRAAGFNDIGDIDAMPMETLQRVLQYHVISAALDASDLPGIDNADQTTMNGEQLYISNNAKGISVNGANVIQADVAAENGFIHVIDNVLFPPEGDLAVTAQNNDDLSFLVAAATRANLVNTLAGTDSLTVFAPTNAAFQAAGYPTIESIQNADMTALANILQYHIVSGRAYSGNLFDNTDLMTISGETIRVETEGGISITGKGNAAPSNVIMSDITADNGVVHVIDRVLLPQE